MRPELKAAYALISNFKRGAIPPVSKITTEQQRLIRLLSDDLEVKGLNLNIEQLLEAVAKADSTWNKRTMVAVDRFYSFQQSGNVAEAESEREKFIQECPSSWYRNIVSSL